MVKRRRGGAILIVLCASALLLASVAFAQDLRFLRIGTGSTAGTYFPVGGLIANAISNPPGSRDCDVGGSCGVPGVIAAAVSTQGSVENVIAVSEGELDLALSQADVAYLAFSGFGLFAETGPRGNLRAIANLYPEAVHLVTRADAGISTVADLANRRVSLGEPESGTRVVAKIVLAAWGLSENDVVSFYDKLGRASDMLVAGEIDAMFIVGGYPLSAVEQAAGLVSLELTPIDGEPATDIMRDHRFLMAETIPADIYGDLASTPTLAVGAQLLVSAEADDDFVYDITKALWHPNNRKLLDSGHPNGELIRLDTALHGVAIPLHPGAQRFYEEQGLIQLNEFQGPPQLNEQ